MKRYLCLLAAAISLASCSNKPTTDSNRSQDETSKTQVSIIHATQGSIDQEISLTATTAYLKKSVVSAPIAAFIITSNVEQGTRVRAGQLLYKLESKEQHALNSGNGNIIPIRASRSGIVLDVQQLAGGYVTEGTVLCTIADAGSLVFKINVPYEQKRYVKQGGRCTLELPDGTPLSASIASALATMETTSQSEQVIARASSPFLPEGMNVKAIFKASGQHADRHLIVSREAVQSDETLTSHWVMVIDKDNTVRKVPIEVGNSNATETEILSGNLNVKDRIVRDGGYGLEEGSKVVVTK